MDRQNLHIIHKQVMEIRVDNVRYAQEIESRFKELIKIVNSPEFEDCFEGLLRPDQHLLIERLEINLGIFKKESLVKEISSALYRALREALLTNLTKSTPIFFPEKLGEYKHGSESIFKENGNLQSYGTYSGIEGPFEVFIFFLEKGRVPHWVPVDFSFELKSFESLNENQKTLFRRLLLHSDQALLRLATKFSLKFIEQILSPFGRVKIVWENWRWLEAHLKMTPLDPFSFKKHYWVNAIPIILQSAQGKLTDIFLAAEVIQRTWDKFPEKALISLERLLMEKSISPSMKDNLRTVLEKIFKSKLTDQEESEKSDKVSTGSPLENTVPGQIVAEGPLENRREWLDQEKVEEKPKFINNGNSPNKEPIPVYDAGLVLLWPFLSELFKSCNLLEKGLFKSLEDQTRAVNILCYLAYGMEELPEYRKLLQKLLCGVAWETVLPEVLPITDGEKELADEMLKAVVVHWKALRNSSPEAVQEAFIRRSGQLVLRDQGIHLEVEKKTQDILLSQLPWGFSMIKLQWMPHILYVSWN